MTHTKLRRPVSRHPYLRAIQLRPIASSLLLVPAGLLAVEVAASADSLWAIAGWMVLGGAFVSAVMLASLALALWATGGRA